MLCPWPGMVRFRHPGDAPDDVPDSQKSPGMFPTMFPIGFPIGAGTPWESLEVLHWCLIVPRVRRRLLCNPCANSDRAQVRDSDLKSFSATSG